MDQVDQVDPMDSKPPRKLFMWSIRRITIFLRASKPLSDFQKYSQSIIVKGLAAP